MSHDFTYFCHFIFAVVPANIKGSKTVNIAGFGARTGLLGPHRSCLIEASLFGKCMISQIPVRKDLEVIQTWFDSEIGLEGAVS
jgi:hypothetical protein